MQFKRLVQNMTDAEFLQIYQELDCRAQDRKTDLSEKCLKYILDHLDQKAENLVDLGCGQGFFLQQTALYTNKALTEYGLDLITAPRYKESFQYIKGDLNNLPFSDNSIDIVTCFHTLEHLRDYQEALNEIKRIARKQVIIVVPRQHYFFYSLDLHLHFFPAKTDLTHCIDIEDYTCDDIQGDWVYIGYL